MSIVKKILAWIVAKLKALFTKPTPVLASAIIASAAAWAPTPTAPASPVIVTPKS